MKYYASLPLTALFALSVIHALVEFGVIPAGSAVLTMAQGELGDYFYLLIFAIILAESIVYVGFYFPGQFFAVVMVISAQPSARDILSLTGCMVAAATLGSWFNYQLGARLHAPSGESKSPGLRVKPLLLAMIHMNALAFYMFNLGANRGDKRMITLAGVINLPYYMVLISATAMLSESVMQMAENTVLLFILLTTWLAIALFFDWKAGRLTVFR